jgi:hypothetical protein
MTLAISAQGFIIAMHNKNPEQQGETLNPLASEFD